eukprot:scaffold16863_cov33-Tisochrysis_lutea.AAC.3
MNVPRRFSRKGRELHRGFGTPGCARAVPRAVPRAQDDMELKDERICGQLWSTPGWRTIPTEEKVRGVTM